MNFINIFATSGRSAAAIGLLALAMGCATTKHTEQMLGDAGFKRVAAQTPKQVQHLKTLPADRLTVVKVNGKTFYVFPDPAHNILYLGNPEEYQTYKESVSLQKLEGQNRVDAIEDQASGDDAGTWVEWTSSSGWTHGND